MRALVATVGVLGAIAAGSLSTARNLADACAGLIGSNGAVNLGRTTTFAAYSDGVEHYITAFKFQGGGGEFGSLIPLPGVPTNVERGGDWTLQRLQRETHAAACRRAAGGVGGPAAASGATVLQEVRIDALDLTVLSGGGDDVAVWAQEHGFRLSPDAPEVLDFYAARSPIFLAAVFDSGAAAERGQQLGDGTPVHITIPTDNPWVPLRILGLGKQADDFVQADVYLLTDDKPAILPRPRQWSLPRRTTQPASDLAAQRPAVGRGDELGAAVGLADEARGRQRHQGPALRPRGRHDRGAESVAGGRRTRSAPVVRALPFTGAG